MFPRREVDAPVPAPPEGDAGVTVCDAAFAAVVRQEVGDPDDEPELDELEEPDDDELEDEELEDDELDDDELDEELDDDELDEVEPQ